MCWREGFLIGKPGPAADNSWFSGARSQVHCAVAEHPIYFITHEVFHLASRRRRCFGGSLNVVAYAIGRQETVIGNEPSTTGISTDTASGTMALLGQHDGILTIGSCPQLARS